MRTAVTASVEKCSRVAQTMTASDGIAPSNVAVLAVLKDPQEPKVWGIKTRVLLHVIGASNGSRHAYWTGR